MMKKTLTLLLGAAAIGAYAGLPNSMSKMSFDSQSDAVQTTYGVKSESANAGADIKRAADKVEMPTPHTFTGDPSFLLLACSYDTETLLPFLLLSLGQSAM